MTRFSRFLLAFASVLSVSCGGGSSKQCTSCPDAACTCETGSCAEDAGEVAEDIQEAGSDLPVGDEGTTFPDCLAGKVQCAAGESEQYGVCVKDAEAAIVGGTFTMGKDGAAADAPAHEVTIGPFHADRTEVSNRVYRACVSCGACTKPSRDGSYSGREPYYGNPEFDDYPVIHVTWDQAVAFCEGLGKRLPTEAEWEFVARGAEGRLYPWGSESASAKRVNAAYYVGDTTAVTAQADGATPDGILNLAGNVWDWVHDVYDSKYYAASPAKDPRGPDSGVVHVVRGGSFGSPLDFVAGHVRYSMFGLDSYSSVGFRCVY